MTGSLVSRPTWRAAGGGLRSWAQSSPDLDAAPRAVKEPATGRTQAVQAYALLHAVAVQDGLIEVNPCQLKGAGRTRPAERVPATPAQLVTMAAGMPARYQAAVPVAAWSGAAGWGVVRAAPRGYRPASPRCSAPRRTSLRDTAGPACRPRRISLRETRPL